MLEGENRTGFFAHVIPLTGWNSLEERQRLIRVGVGGVKRLLEGERYPSVEFVVERADGHGAIAIGQALQGKIAVQSGSGHTIDVACFGLVHAVQSVERPAGVAARRIGVEEAGERKAELRETARGANRTLRGNHLPAAGIGA